MSSKYGFIKGFGSTLDLFGPSRREEPKFEYNGVDITRESDEDAIDEAWFTLGDLMTAYLADSATKED